MINYLLMAAPQEGAPGGGLGAFMPLLIIIVIFYFFMIRPQMKRQKEVRNFRDSLKKGDKVLTLSGVYGKITDVQDTTVMLEIAPDVRVKIDKAGLVKDNTDIGQAAAK